MSRVVDRVERLESRVATRGQEPPIAIVMLNDLREEDDLPFDTTRWLTWPAALAKAGPPHPNRVRFVHLDSGEERMARGLPPVNRMSQIVPIPKTERCDSSPA
jgi:hypothetical protein